MAPRQVVCRDIPLDSRAGVFKLTMFAKRLCSTQKEKSVQGGSVFSEPSQWTWGVSPALRLLSILSELSQRAGLFYTLGGGTQLPHGPIGQNPPSLSSCPAPR